MGHIIYVQAIETDDLSETAKVSAVYDEKHVKALKTES